MKKAFAVFICEVSTLGLAQTSSADDDDEASSRIFSASAILTAGSQIVPIASIPEGKDFLLTQYCGSAFTGLFLVGSSFGPVTGGGAGCTEYTPGVLIAGGQELSCAVEGLPVPFDLTCLITGFIQ